MNSSEVGGLTFYVVDFTDTEHTFSPPLDIRAILEASSPRGEGFPDVIQVSFSNFDKCSSRGSFEALLLLIDSTYS